MRRSTRIYFFALKLVLWLALAAAVFVFLSGVRITVTVSDDQSMAGDLGSAEVALADVYHRSSVRVNELAGRGITELAPLPPSAQPNQPEGVTA